MRPSVYVEKVDGCGTYVEERGVARRRAGS